VGNNKNLWRVFLEACQLDASLLHDPNPLDAYTERVVQAAAAATGYAAIIDARAWRESCPAAPMVADACASSCRHAVRIFWGHREADTVLGGACLELQRMAAAAGLSYWDPANYLSLHPKYGPWFALRAVIVFDGVEYSGAYLGCSGLHSAWR
jgi:hypothetical protein